MEGEGAESQGLRHHRHRARHGASRACLLYTSWEYPDLPIIATGGPTDDAIRATIAAGADAVSWTPPAIADLEREVMELSLIHISSSKWPRACGR